jgi:prefoldin subunit 5
VAEHIFNSDSEIPPNKPLGRHLGIERDRLWGVREHLVWLIEATWDQAGVELPTIKTAEQIPSVLQIWKERSTEQVVSTLLRPSSTRATSKQLRAQRRELEKLNEKVRSAQEEVERRIESIESAMRIDATQMSEGDQSVVDEQIRKRAAAAAHAGNEYVAVRDRQQNLEILLKDGEAYFARAELFHFRQSKRYRLNPLNIANALAGVPFIGWRQSVKRCKKWESAGEKGVSFQVFEIIRRIVAANARRAELVRDAERWLRNRRSGESAGMADLHKNWYYLRRSIQTELDKGTRTRNLPSAISKEYWRRKSNPSAVDLAFAEDEIIVK